MFISHNLARIIEGKTVSYVNDPENIFPFKPFAYDNNNGLTIVYYLPSNEYKNGDIIIDGGFTKLFNELENEGTFRYIQNLIAYTTKFSKRQFENPNWYYYTDNNEERTIKTRQNILEDLSKPNTIIANGHFINEAFGYLKKEGQKYKFERYTK